MTAAIAVSSLLSGLRMMPRGRRAVLMVFFTSSVSPSITVTVLSFSLETKMVTAKEGVAVSSESAARVAMTENQIMGFPQIASIRTCTWSQARRSQACR